MSRFQRQQDRAAPLPADPNALKDAQHRQQQWSPRADPIVRRQEPDEQRAQPHQEQGSHERRLAADAVPKIAEDHTPQRPGDEADRVGAEGQELSRKRAELRKEQLPKNQRRRRAVQEEVVPLDGRADGAGNDGFDQRPSRRGLVGRRRFLLTHRVPLGSVLCLRKGLIVAV